MKQVASITTIDQKTSSEPQTEEKILTLWQSDWMHLDAMEKLAFFLGSLFRSTSTLSTDSTDSDPNFRRSSANTEVTAPHEHFGPSRRCLGGGGSMCSPCSLVTGPGGPPGQPSGTDAMDSAMCSRLDEERSVVGN